MAKKKAPVKAAAKTKAKTQAKPSAKAAPKKTAAKKAAAVKAKPAAKNSAKASVKPGAKSAGKSAKTAKAAVKTVAKPAAKKEVKPAAKKATKPASKKTKPATNATAKKTGAPVLSLDKARAKKSSGDITGLFSPLDNRIVIRRTGQSDRTPGGLYLPETASERPNQGKVVAVGRGKRDKKGRLQPLDVQIGDVVLFGAYTGAEIELGGEALVVIREDEVLAITKG